MASRTRDRTNGRARPRGNDPLLNTATWRTARTHWRTIQGPCARCGRPIDYDAPRGHPRALIVGHIVSRARARAMGWTAAQINALTNTQPECTTCSARSGARDTNALRRQGKGRPRQTPLTTDPAPRPMTTWETR